LDLNNNSCLVVTRLTDLSSATFAWPLSLRLGGSKF